MTPVRRIPKNPKPAPRAKIAPKRPAKKEQKVATTGSMGKGSRGERRKHLDERLRLIYQRAMLIENELKKLDDDRFYRVCIFGSARIKPDTKDYADVFALARYLGWEGIDVLTGGGPGLMEAANKGARLGREEKSTRTLSYGLSIELDFEPEPICTLI